MPLTIDVDTYLTVADANTYFVNRNNSVWTASLPTDTEKEAALRKATDYLEFIYQGQWVGAVTDIAQVLAWPRVGLIDADFRSLSSTVNPVQIKNATAELALKVLSEDLLVDVPAGGQLKMKKVGPLEQEFNDYAPDTKKFQFVENLIKIFLQPANRLLRV